MDAKGFSILLWMISWTRMTMATICNRIERGHLFTPLEPTLGTNKLKQETPLRIILMWWASFGDAARALMSQNASKLQKRSRLPRIHHGTADRTERLPGARYHARCGLLQGWKNDKLKRRQRAAAVVAAAAAARGRYSRPAWRHRSVT